MQRSESQPGHRYHCNGSTHNFPCSQPPLLPSQEVPGFTGVCMALSSAVGFFIPSRTGMQAGLQQASWYIYFNKSRSSCSAVYSTFPVHSQPRAGELPASRLPAAQPGLARPSLPVGQRRWEAEPRSTFGSGGKTKISQTFHWVTKQIL